MRRNSLITPPYSNPAHVALLHPQAPWTLIQSQVAKSLLSPGVSLSAPPSTRTSTKPPASPAETSMLIATMFENAEGITFEGGTFLNTGGHLNFLPAYHDGPVARQQRQNDPARSEAHMFTGLRNSVFKRNAGDFISSAEGLDYYAPPPATTSTSEASKAIPRHAKTL